ncbi:MAG TPA: hypothetical protein DDZ80_01160 [Cyanobacteria bacterium UBA8803]|nr:hypothetical protein [Cyanobacteria bacterium UBA9273]HBL57215.1 hypothetical protein [Cyanobacteria bacterium UBA8803]
MTQNVDRTKSYEYFLDFFHEYATELLRKLDQDISESLRHRQIPASQITPLEESYKISLKVGKDLDFNSIKKQLIHQLEAAAYFIRDFHIGVLGRRTSLFDLYDVEIQIEENIRYALSFESGKLLIQIPYWQIASLKRYLPYQKLKYRWHRGQQFHRLSPTRRIWWLLNPIGELRSNLRSMLLLAIQKQILGIDKLLIKFGLIDIGDGQSLAAKEEQEVSQRFKETAIAFLKANVNEEKLGVNLELILRDRDEVTLMQLLGLFKKNLADTAQMEELIDVGALTLQEQIQQEQSQVDIKMFGLVNVGNYHRIDIAVNISAGYLKKYVEILPRKADVKAVQFGVVNVYTIDDITVKPNFHGAMTLNFETAALERALKELDLVPIEN